MLTMPVVMPSPPVRSGPGPAEGGSSGDVGRGPGASGAAAPAFSETLKATATKRESRPEGAVDAPAVVRPVREPEARGDVGPGAGADGAEAVDVRPDDGGAVAAADGEEPSTHDGEPAARTPVGGDRAGVDEPRDTDDGEADVPVLPVDAAQDRPVAVVAVGVGDGDVPEAWNAPAVPAPGSADGTMGIAPQGDVDAGKGESVDVDQDVIAGRTSEQPADGRVAVTPGLAAERVAVDAATAARVVEVKPEGVERRGNAKSTGSARPEPGGSTARTGGETVVRGAAGADGDVPAEDGDASGGNAKDEGGVSARAAAGHVRGAGIDGSATDDDADAPAGRREELHLNGPARTEGRQAERAGVASGAGDGASAEPGTGVFKVVAEPVAARVGGEPVARVDGGVQAMPGTRSAGSAQQGATANSTGAQDADGPATTATVRGLAAALMQKGGSVTIRLMPEMLGDLKIQMTIDRGSVSVDLTARSAEAHDLLSRSMGTLRSALEARGLGVERMSVHLSTQGPAQPGPTSGDQTPTRDEQRAGGQHDAGGGASRGRDDGRGASGDRSGGAGNDSDADEGVGRGAHGPDARGFATRLRLSLDAVA